jgi:hypothetical protein
MSGPHEQKSENGGKNELPEKFLVLRQAFVMARLRLDEVVHESKDGICQKKQNKGEIFHVNVDIDQDHDEQDYRYHYRKSAHRGRAGFHKVGGRPFLADGLAHLEHFQRPYDGEADKPAGDRGEKENYHKVHTDELYQNKKPPSTFRQTGVFIKNDTYLEIQIYADRNKRREAYSKPRP